MGFGGKFLFIALFASMHPGLNCQIVVPVQGLPTLNDTDYWFGNQNNRTVSTAINNFKVNISDAVLQDLQYRLQNARIAPSLPNERFNYGFNLDYLSQVVVPYWKNQFDWRAQEEFINSFPQFKTQIYGLDIHFLHIKPLLPPATNPTTTVVPILLNHGWPQTFYDFSKIIPLLLEPVNGLAFEIIVPSIPGIGFSDPPQVSGFETIACAATYNTLMNRLGITKYFIHGNDWGAMISLTMVHYFPQNILGLHIGTGSLDFTAQITDPIFSQEFGYFFEHRTKPNSIGALFYDSPAGLAAFLLQGWSSFTNVANDNKTDGGLLESFTFDTLLTEIMLYWVSNNVVASVRWYKENSVAGYFGTPLFMTPTPAEVPIGAVNFPNDLDKPNETLARELWTNLIHYTNPPTGGHFAALEVPQLLVDDLRQFVQQVLNGAGS